MNKIKNIYLSLKLSHLIFLLLLVFFLLVLSILEIIGLASIPVLLSSMLDQKDFSLQYMNIDLIKNYLLSLPQKNQLEFLCIAIICLFIFKNFFHASIIFYQGQIVKSLRIFISQKLFEYYLNQDYLDLIKKNSAVIIRILSVDVGNTSIYILNFLNLLKESLILIAIICLLFFSNKEITVFLFLIFFLVVAVFYFLNRKKLFQRGKKVQGLLSNVINIINGMIGLFKELKIYNLSNFIYNDYTNKIKETEKYQFINYFIISLPRLILELSAVILIISIIFVQLQKESNALTILPFLSLVVVAAVRMIPVFNTFTTSLSVLKSIQPSFDLVFSELSNLRRISSDNKEIDKIEFKNKIELKNVSFKYQKNGPYIIKTLNLNVKKGDKIGLVGESGTGKSTLINIIMGLLKQTEGKIYVDNKELQSEKNQLIANIGYVPQEVFLFEGELKKNIALGLDIKKISEEKLIKAANAAQITKFVKNLEKSFDSFVEENGRNFSVGQKQRIGVARALYRNPDILILDESTSSLDAETEEKFIEDIFNIGDEKTIIFISHKMSALSKCDKIFDLKQKRFIK